MRLRNLFMVAFCVFPLLAVSAQQITKFAVVDTSRIYTTFYRDSRSVRDYEAKKSQYQGEIKRMSDEIKDLRQQKVDADAAKDVAKVSRLDSDITAKTNFLLDYTKAKNAELDALKKKLTSDDEFYSMLYEEIRKIAEADGYSMVLSLQEGSSILWYSPTVDITDKVIRDMTTAQ
ncbi:MAG TPA: OmpH family outer membrane protein [Treponemataceae bacterium]|nr:OmpH family outer membrane protein [Treponemataceae bacterium]HPS44511.1 OmpH family outer membrane protein [Treponemataceae bacterium]